MIECKNSDKNLFRMRVCNKLMNLMILINECYDAYIQRT